MVVGGKRKVNDFHRNTNMNKQLILEASAIKLAPTQAVEDPDFTSIDDPNIKWPPFMLSMLRVGRILLKNVNTRHDVTAQQISRVMERHHSEVGTLYKPLEIRELIGNYCCLIVGGGIQVEAQKLDLSGPSKRCPYYRFTFTKIFRPEGTP